MHTYTILLKCIDDGKLPLWSKMACPKEAIEYYDLPQTASMRDLILAVRADESCHREVNHHFADCNYWDDIDSSSVSLNDKEDAAKLNFDRDANPQIEKATKDSDSNEDKKK